MIKINGHTFKGASSSVHGREHLMHQCTCSKMFTWSDWDPIEQIEDTHAEVGMGMTIEEFAIKLGLADSA